MTFSDKIDEWIKEAETRPSSALLILKLVAGRLRDLTERNEELLAENIALQDGTRVQELQKRLTHLEYQLEMLKRRVGADGSAQPALPVETEALNLLVYSAQGQIFRLELGENPSALGRITGELTLDGEFPRLLAVPAQEEVLLLFTSGRISTLTVADLPLAVGQTWSWEQAALPDEPHAGELLACLMPLSRLSLSDYFLQASRRGCVKKTLISMAQSVLGNHYLGRGALQKSDQAFDALLCQKKERYALVTYEGRLIGLEIDDLPYSAEERLKISATDYLAAAFTLRPDQSIFCLTQNGKIIQREAGFLELAKSPSARGQALIPPSRLEQGTRFIGAAAVKAGDQVVALDAEGQLTVHLAAEAAGAGSIRTGALVLAMGIIPLGDSPMTLKVGLDFGTSNSGIALFDGRKVTVLPLDRENVLPEVVKSVLYVTRDYKCAIGQSAVELYYRDNVNRQRRFVKQWAGEIDYRGSDMHYVRDIFVYVDELKPGRLLQYLKTALRKDGFAGTQIFERYYTVGDLVQTYLGLLKGRAEELLGEKIDGVTLGRPVKFSTDPVRDQQAEETLRQAAYAVGFKEVDFELEPMAAALDYEQTLEKPQNVVIFDFGGGTLDLAVMRLGGKERRVYANGGVDIAGSDFDRAIIEKRMLPNFGLGKISHQPEIQEMIAAVPDWMALPDLATPSNRNILEKAIRAQLAPVRLRALEALIYNDLAFTFYNRVEAAKIALSTDGATVITLDDKELALWELYTRHQFETDIFDYVGEVEKVLLETLAAAGLEPGQIEAVVKTGGSSNIPLFTAMLARIFGAEKVKQSNAFSSVVAGLAIKAGM